MTPKIPISDYAPKRNWNERPGIREKWEGFEEWLCAAVCTAGLWLVVWAGFQLWRFLMRQGG